MGVKGSLGTNLTFLLLRNEMYDYSVFCIHSMSYIDHICHTLLGSLGRKYPAQPATSQQPTSYNPYQPQTTPAYQPNNPAMSQNTPQQGVQQPGVQQPGMDLNASHGSVVLCAYNCMIKTDSQFLKYTKYILLFLLSAFIVFFANLR